MYNDITIKLNRLHSDYYDAFVEEYDEIENNGEISIIRFSPLITDEVVEAFNTESYTPETMNGIIELYDYLQIDLAKTYKRCEFGIYSDYRNWKAHDCMKTANFNMKEYARNGLLKFMQHAYENGCPCGPFICEIAAEYGQLECLKYGHKNCGYLNQYAFLFAAANGHL